MEIIVDEIRGLFGFKSKAELIFEFLDIRLERIFGNIKPIKDEIIDSVSVGHLPKRIINIVSSTNFSSRLCTDYFDTIDVKVERKSKNNDYMYSKFITTDDNINITLKTLNYSPSFERFKDFWFGLVEYVGVGYWRKKDTLSDWYLRLIIENESGGLGWRLNDKGNDMNFNTFPDQTHICDVNFFYYKELNSCGTYGHFALNIDNYNHLIKVVDNKRNELKTRNWLLKYHSPILIN